MAELKKTEDKKEVTPAAGDNKNTNTAVFDTGARASMEPTGASGTQIFSGYFSEEYLQKLRGRRGAKVYDEMRRSESQVAMLINAIMNTIKSGTWEVDEAKEVSNSELHKEFIEECRTNMINWDSYIHEALTFFIFGFSIHEVVHKLIFDHPKFGTVIGLKGLAFRSQKTIERWHLNDDTGELQTVEQWVQGDTVPTGSDIRKMDAQHLLVMSYNKEGDNFEGISALRPMYGPYFRKSLYQKILAIGIEQNAKGTVVGTTPAGLDSTDPQIAAFRNTLENFVAHENAFIMVPEGWKIEIKNNDFDAEKVAKIIVAENTEMINSICANFLALGTNGGGGAYALGSDLSDFMLNGIKCIADIPVGVWNRVLIPNLIKLNFGPQEAYPKLKVTNIDDKAGKELAEIIKSLVDGKVIKADDKLENFVRKQYDMPEADPTTARESAPPTPFGGNPLDPNNPNPPAPGKPPTPIDPNKKSPVDDMPEEAKKLHEERLQLAEGGNFTKLFDKNKVVLKDVMQSGLKTLLDNYKADLKKAWANATPASKPALAMKLSPKGLNDYKVQLREALADCATQGLARARKQTPWFTKRIKLSEHIDTMKLADNKGGFYDALPSHLKRLIKANADLIAETQNTDISKLVSFQYGNSLSQDSIDQILADIDATAQLAIAGATGKGFSIDAAAGNAVAQSFEQAKTSWFFEPEVLETLESMTYKNDVPNAEVCVQLVGTTLAIDDPLLDTYATPLHHNCDGEWIPNQRGKGPDIKRGGVPLTQKALDSITLCECRISSNL